MKIGILKHRDRDDLVDIVIQDFIRGCNRYDVDYEVIDFHNANWLELVKNSNCDGFIHRPMHIYNEKVMAMEKIAVLESLGYIVHPRSREVMFYESKVAQTHFLQAHNIPMPKTKVYYTQHEAYNAFEDLKREDQEVNTCVVWKSNMGSSSMGVKMINTTFDLYDHVDTLFSDGILCPQKNYLNRNSIEYDFCLLQQYIRDAQEWRVLIIGNKLWARKKMTDSKDFRASGKGLVQYATPPSKLIQLAQTLQDKLQFSALCIDILEYNEDFYVSEFSTYWGNEVHGKYLYPMKNEDGIPGCYLFSGEWYTWHNEDVHINELRILNLKRAIEAKQRGYND